MEVANLILNVGNIGRLGLEGRIRADTLHTVAAHQHNVADLAVLHPLVELLQVSCVARYQADADLEVGGGGLIRELEHPPACRPVHCYRLLHEHVELLGDGVGEMDPAKRGWGGKNDHVSRLQRIHRVLVGIETDELPLLGHVHLRAVVLHEIVAGLVEPVLEDVRHRNQLDWAACGGDGVDGGAAAASSAADQGYLDEVASAGMNAWKAEAWKKRRGGDASAGLEDLAT